MVAKRAMAILLSVSLVFGTCPTSRIARAAEPMPGEGRAGAAAPLEQDDVGAPAPSDVAAPDTAPDTTPDTIAPAAAALSPDELEAAATEPSEGPLAHPTPSAPTTTLASPEPTVFLQSAAGLPAQFDLRDLGVVTPVKQQEPWGDCWAHAAIAAAETSILSTMGSTYAETGLDLSERHLSWYVANPVTEATSSSQVGEGLYVYDLEAGPNHVLDFGGREQCAATLFAQGIGPALESDYPYRGANGDLAYEGLLANKETYLQRRIAVYKGSYPYLSDGMLRSMAEDDYDYYVEKYRQYDVYSPFDDWSITEPDEPGSGKLRGANYTLTDNNVFSYWGRFDDIESPGAAEHFYKQPLCKNDNYVLWQDTIDQIKTELYEGRGVSIGVTMGDASLNTETWSAYDYEVRPSPSHVVCIVGWDDNYDASNFTHTTGPDGKPLWGDEETAAQRTTPPGNGAWIAKNSWGSQTDAIAGGLTASDGTTKDANASEWGIVDENGKHTGYYYLSYYDGTLGVPESFAFALEPNNDQQDALQLDYLPASVTEFAYTEERPMWEANIFALEKDMRIDEVATRLRISDKVPLEGFTCTFDLYKLNDDATNPDDGTLVATLTRTFQSQGYHRVALDAPVYLTAGERLGIVVQQTHTTDDGVTLYGIEAQECDGYREIHRDPVYGQPVVNKGESFFKIEERTGQEEASQDGWLDITAPLSEELLLYIRPDLADAPFLLDFYIENFCGEPISDFFMIDNFGIKAFGEPISLEHVDAVAPTCEEAGSVEHWLDLSTGVAYADESGTEVLEDTTVAALGHKWDAGSVAVEPTCTEQGTRSYTCKNDTAHRKSEPIAALGHDWGAASYTWSKDLKTCTATRVCARDASHKETAKAEVASKVTTKATAKKSGVRTYTATFGEDWAKTQTKREAIPATGSSGTTSSKGASASLPRTGDEGAGPVGALAMAGIGVLCAGASLRRVRWPR